jgi:hypothetical protein
MHPGLLHRRFVTDLSSSLFSFVLPLLPTQEERAVKEEYVGSILLYSPLLSSALYPTPIPTFRASSNFLSSWTPIPPIKGAFRVKWNDESSLTRFRRVRSLIEKLVKTIEPSARLLSFGSSQNSFGLRNSGKWNGVAYRTSHIPHRTTPISPVMPRPRPVRWARVEYRGNWDWDWDWHCHWHWSSR